VPTLDELNPTATTSPSNIPSATPFVLDADELLAAFTNFLTFDVGSGGASAETIRTYWCEVRYYLKWCETNQLQPLTVTRDQIKIYRHHLVSQKYKPATISLKLVAISRMYDAAMEYRLLTINPVWGVKPPKQRSDPAERITYLTTAEAQALLQAPLAKPTSLKTLRDQLLLGIMTLSAHSLRHTAATLAIQSGASLRQVQDLLGHADPRTTAIYTHIGDRWLNNPALNLGINLNPEQNS
jgi:site-specific recombinase XerD